MTAARREHPLERLSRNFDTLFGRMMGGSMTPFGQEEGSLRLWDFDVSEGDKEVTVRAEVPGFEPNEIDVRIDNGTLTIKAEKEQKGEGREEYRSFVRSVTVGPDVDADKAHASYRNGVLELRIPRTESARPKRIPIHGHQGTTVESGSAAPQINKQEPKTEKKPTEATTEKTKK